MGVRDATSVWLLLASTWLIACGGNSADEPQGGTGGQGGDGGGGIPSCAPNEAARPDGSCVQVGVELCAIGFVSDTDGGCDPIVPADECPPGTMKLLGESACVDIAPCGGRWGRAPIDASTRFVDKSYAGSDSDGSEQKPWTSIAAGVASAADGAVVAVAAGSYPEKVELSKPVRLWGACPAAVTIASGDEAGVLVSAAGAEVHDLSVSNSKHGIVSVAADTLLEAVWVHDTHLYGIYFDGESGAPASGTIRHSAVNRVYAVGVAAYNADILVEDLHVHEPRPDANGISGVGIRARPGDKPTSIVVDGAVIQRAYSAGVQLFGVSAILSRLYIDETLGRAADGVNGSGMLITPRIDELSGTTYRADVTLDGAVITRSLQSALHSEDATITVSNTVFRQVSPNAVEFTTGQGLYVLAWDANSRLTMRTSLIEQVVAAGVFVASGGQTTDGVAQADAYLERVWVRDVALTADGYYGFGIYAQGSFDATTQSELTVRDSLVEDTVAGGVVALDTNMTLAGSEVREVLADSFGEYGDAVIAQRYFAPGATPLMSSIAGVFLRSAARAGVANFGLDVGIDGVWIECSAFSFNGEQASNGTPYAFDVRGDNHCTCNDERLTCQVLSSGLPPPPPLE